jgi:hypothetical protein
VVVTIVGTFVATVTVVVGHDLSSNQVERKVQLDYGGESTVCFRKSKSVLNFSCAASFELYTARCFSHIAYNSFLLIIPIELCGRFWQITLATIFYLGGLR